MKTKKRKNIWLLLLLLLAIPMLAVANNTSEKKISIHQSHVTLSTVLDDLKAQSGYSILIRNNDLNLDQIVSISADQLSISDLLDQLFKNTGIDYEIAGTQISIYKPKSPAAGKSTKTVPKK